MKLFVQSSFEDFGISDEWRISDYFTLFGLFCSFSSHVVSSVQVQSIGNDNCNDFIGIR